jgi:hypothetical protein
MFFFRDHSGSFLWPHRSPMMGMPLRWQQITSLLS